MTEKEKKKAFDDKVKRFDKNLLEILTNIAVSAITTLFILAKLGLFQCLRTL